MLKKSNAQRVIIFQFKIRIKIIERDHIAILDSVW